MPVLKIPAVRGGQKSINIIDLSTDYDYNPVVLMKWVSKMNSNFYFLSNKFPKLYNIGSLAEKNLYMEDHLSLLEKSILSKALRGELGTNYPNKKNAINLLQEILSETSSLSREKKSSLKIEVAIKGDL